MATWIAVIALLGIAVASGLVFVLRVAPDLEWLREQDKQDRSNEIDPE